MLTVDNWNGASLSSVLEQALQVFQEGPYRHRVNVKRNGEVWIDANRSMMLSMALHELATNAVKYGALSNDEGQVTVACERQMDSRRLAIVWRESGGPAVKPPDRRGFGLTLIERALAGAAGRVHLDFSQEGLACRIEVAL
jgi:two-component sensor histidine kinase